MAAMMIDRDTQKRAAAETAAAMIEDGMVVGLGTDPQPRRDAEGKLFCTDGGNRILDCRFGAIGDPAGLDLAIGQTVGVVETGLFIGMARLALVADDSGVRRVTIG